FCSVGKNTLKKYFKYKYKYFATNIFQIQIQDTRRLYYFKYKYKIQSIKCISNTEILFIPLSGLWRFRTRGGGGRYGRRIFDEIFSKSVIFLPPCPALEIFGSRSFFYPPCPALKIFGF